jgi:hypothetical protein
MKLSRTRTTIRFHDPTTNQEVAVEVSAATLRDLQRLARRHRVTVAVIAQAKFASLVPLIQRKAPVVPSS